MAMYTYIYSYMCMYIAIIIAIFDIIIAGCKRKHACHIYRQFAHET